VSLQRFRRFPGGWSVIRKARGRRDAGFVMTSTESLRGNAGSDDFSGLRRFCPEVRSCFLDMLWSHLLDELNAVAVHCAA
jgi:hypothetical protein